MGTVQIELLMYYFNPLHTFRTKGILESPGFLPADVAEAFIGENQSFNQ